MKEPNKVKTIISFLIFTIGLALVAVSLYLTDHYFTVHFPKDLNQGTFCSISRFWNCDNASFSPFSNILSIPTSLFGAFFGMIIIFGALLPKATVIQNNYFLAIINFLGCLFLLAYSLLFLHGLCPGCTVYYILSTLALIIFIFHYPFMPIPSLKLNLIYGVLAIAMMLASFFYNKERTEQQDKMLGEWVHSLSEKEIYKDDNSDFSYPIVKANDDFFAAPLHITLFSDFQCPYCKVLGQEIEKIAGRYQGKLNVRYMFYPLDSGCNKSLHSPMHPYACMAAQIAYCAKDNFLQIHDEIYEHQSEINSELLLNLAKKHNLLDCYNSEESKNNVLKIVDKAQIYSLEGAPNMLINGHKISGLLPAKALVFLLDYLLLRNN